MKNRETIISKEEIQDKELVEQIKKGNEEAFDILIRRYHNMVYFTCIKKLYNPDIAREATQEVFIKVWKNINTCADGTYFVSWLMTIARNHCIDILRKEKNRKEREISIETFENSDNMFPNTSEHSSTDKSIEYEYLNILVEQLPEPQRIVFQKRLEGWSVQEIADELNCPLGTVLSRFSLAKRKIYEQMKKMNISFKEL